MTLIHIVITGVKVAVHLHYRHTAASLPEDAEGVILAEGSAERLLKYLYLDMTNVIFNPLIKNSCQKVAKLNRTDTSSRDLAFF